MNDTLSLADLTDDPPHTGHWSVEGYEILPRLMPEDLMQAYEREWWAAHGSGPFCHNGSDWAAWEHVVTPGGWPDPVPYTRHESLANLMTYEPLSAAIEDLIGEPAGLHLNLTGWVSTERSWHADSYLNPAATGDYYAAVWIALDTIHPDSGPFQCVPGSHHWPVVTKQKIGRHVDLSPPEWPKHSEQVLEPLYEAEIARTGSEIYTHLPRRGDVLIWHPRLLHQGSKPNVPGMQRRAVISHYTGIHRNVGFPPAVQYSGGWVYPLRDAVKNPVIW